MNKDELTKLRDVVDAAIEEEEKREAEDYKKQNHTVFEKGDWVTNGEEIGVVGWVENKCHGLSESDGYFGLDIKNGNGGFRAPCKRNEYWLLPNELRCYYESLKTITLNVTGEEIEAFYMSYLGMKNINPSSLKSKLIEAFDSARIQNPAEAGSGS